MDKIFFLSDCSKSHIWKLILKGDLSVLQSPGDVCCKNINFVKNANNLRLGFRPNANPEILVLQKISEFNNVTATCIRQCPIYL